jgi:hypothetical protein
MRHQIPNVRINSDNICSVNNEICKNNSTDICYQCQIMSGSPKFPIKFVPGLSIPKLQPDQIDQKKIIIQLPPLPEEVKAPPTEDDLDEGNFVYFVAPTIFHAQSSRKGFHRHYLMSGWIGNYCFLCGGVSTSNEHTCDFCDSIFNLEQCYVMADKIHLSEAVFKAS